MQYKIYLMKVDDDGDEYELKSRTVTADEMVELLISVPEESVELEEPEEEEKPDPVPEKPRGGVGSPARAATAGSRVITRRPVRNSVVLRNKERI